MAVSFMFLLTAVEIAETMVINEVLSNAPGQDSGSGTPGDRFEFIELFNGTDVSLDLSGWFIDDGDSRDEIRPWEEPTLPWPGVLTGTAILSPGHFALVVDPEVTDSGPLFPYPVPESTLVLTVSNTTLGDGLSVNDPVSLLNSEGSVIDTYGTPDLDDGFPYDPGDGISLERLDPSSDDSPVNWGPCISPPGATPGAVNSLTRTIDAVIIDGVLTPSKRNPESTETIRLSCTVSNFGRDALPAVSVGFFSGEGLSPIIDETSKFTVKNVPSGMLPGDSVKVEASWSSAKSGFYSFMAVVGTTGDDFRDNDTARTRVRVGRPLSPIVINEVYVWREGEEPQWIELYNSSSALLEITGWQLADEGKRASGLVNQKVFVPGHSYLIITGNRDEFNVRNPDVPPFKVEEATPFPVFNKGGDSVVLCDQWGMRIDSLSYGGAPDDGVGVSWERVSAGVHSFILANWTLSLDPDGSTPGRANSVAMKSIPSERALEVRPRVITPDGDGRDDRARISYRVPYLSATVSLRVFTSTGIEVATIVKGVKASGEGSFLWDGKGNDGIVVPTGLYILLLETLEEDTERMSVLKSAVVVAPRF
ncbi:MAG: lamin tail domain-containing protein [Candidatus Glassbacteria bacterium]